jgi:outer membrane protein
MKKTFFFALSALVALTACNNKQENETEAEAAAPADTEEITGLKVAYIEIDSLMSQYQFCVDYNLLLNQKSDNAANTLQQKQRALQQHAAALQKKYESNGFTTRDELENAQNQLAREQQDLAELEQRLTNELAMENAKLNAELRDSIQAFLKVYNKTKKYDYIMSKLGDNLLWANKKFDITKEVIAGLNKRYKKGKPAAEAKDDKK